MTIDLTMARMKTKELMAATMGSHEASNAFYKELKSGTKQSVVALDMMLNAMNGIKIGTGITNQQLSTVRPTIQKVGEACIMMGDDTEHATFVMKEAMSGLNGDFQVLKEQFGITKEKMLDAGWSGAADDVEGYAAALEKCMEPMGDFSGIADTTSGKVEQIKKNFRTAGLDIGEKFVPYIDMAVAGFLDLQNSGGPVSEAILWIGGGVSTLASIAPTISPLIDSFNQMKGLAKDVKNGFDKINIFKKNEDGISKWDQLNKKFDELKGKLPLNIGDKVKGIKDSVINKFEKLGKKISDLKGKRPGLNIGDKVKGIKDSVISKFDTLKSKISSVKSTVSGLNLGSKISGVKDSVISSFGTLKDKITSAKSAATGLDLGSKITGVKESVLSGLSTMKTSLQGVKTAIAESSIAETVGSAATTVYTAAKTALTTVTTAATTAFKAFTATLMANPIILVVAAVVALVAILWYLYNTNEGVRNTLNAIADTIKGALLGAWNALSGVITTVSGILQDAWTAACQAFESASQGVESVITRLTEIFDGFKNVLTGIFTGDLSSLFNGLIELFGPDLGGAIVDALNNAYNMITGGGNPLQGIMDWLTSSLGDIPGKIGEALGNIPQIISDALSGLGNAVIPGGGLTAGILSMLNPLPALIGLVFQRIAPTVMPMIQGAWNTIIGLFGQLGSRIIQTFTSIPQRIAMSFMHIVTQIRLRLNQARAVASMMMTNLRNAIVQRIVSLPARIGQTFNLMVQFIRTRLNKARAQAGQLASQIKQAIVDRIMQMYNDVRNWFSQLASNIASWLSTAAANTLAGAKQIYDNIVNKVKEIPQKVADEFGKIPGKITSALASAASAAASGAAAIISSFKSALGIASPGYAQRMTEAEFNTIPVHIENSGILATAQAYRQASNIVSAWEEGLPGLNKPFLTMTPSYPNGLAGVLGGDAVDVGIVGQGLTHMNRTPISTNRSIQNNNHVNRDSHSKTVIVKEIKLDCNNLTQAQSRRILYNALEGL